eukprot:750125-Hanusia_phi.AAC.1
MPGRVQQITPTFDIFSWNVHRENVRDRDREKQGRGGSCNTPRKGVNATVAGLQTFCSTHGWGMSEWG